MDVAFGSHTMRMQFPEKGFEGKIALVEGEKAVSWLWLKDMYVSFEGHPVHTAGIAGVGTAHECRGKGYSRQVLEATTDFLRKQRLPLALLYGIRHFYSKYGYATVYPWYRVSVPVFFARRLGKPKGYAWRHIEQKDMPAVIRMYQRVCFPRTGMRARDAKRYTSFTKGSTWNSVAEPYGLFRRGALAAYAVLDLKPDGVDVCEEAGATYEDRMALLAYLAVTAEERSASEIVLHAPPDDALVLESRRFGGEVKVNFDADGGPMAQVVCLEAFLTQAGPMLRERAGTGWTALFETRDDRVLVRMGKSGAEVVPANKSAEAQVFVKAAPGALAQLFYGYRALDEIALCGDVVVKGRGELARKIFRLEYAHMMPPDYF